MRRGPAIVRRSALLALVVLRVPRLKRHIVVVTPVVVDVIVLVANVSCSWPTERPAVHGSEGGDGRAVVARGHWTRCHVGNGIARPPPPHGYRCRGVWNDVPSGSERGGPLAGFPVPASFPRTLCPWRSIEVNNPI